MRPRVSARRPKAAAAAVPAGAGRAEARPRQAARPAASPRSRDILLLLPAGGLLLVFFILPYLNLLLISFFTPSPRAPYLRILTLANYDRLVRDAFTWGVVWRTVWLGALTTALCLLLSYPLAYHLARARRGAKAALMVLVVSPLLVGVLIRTYGWMVLLQDTGLINQALQALGLRRLPLMYNQTGAIIGLVHVFIPFMVLTVAAAIQGIDPELELAARSLGAGAWRTFWRVTGPLSLHGVLAGTVLVFVLAESSYVIPSLLGGFTVLTVPILVVRTITELFNWPGGSAFAMLFFAITLGVLWLYLRAAARFTRPVV
jgi:putative spermidine/putrescine transport system permease protein